MPSAFGNRTARAVTIILKQRLVGGGYTTIPAVDSRINRSMLYRTEVFFSVKGRIKTFLRTGAKRYRSVRTDYISVRTVRKFARIYGSFVFVTVKFNSTFLSVIK